MQAQRNGEEEIREEEAPGLNQRKPGAGAEGGKQGKQFRNQFETHQISIQPLENRPGTETFKSEY